MSEDSPEPISPSHFNMIRCILAVAHADGEIQEEERAFISKMTSKLTLSPEQQDRLEKDFEEPQDVIALFDKIEQPQFKSQVIHFARIMAWKDDALDPGEQEIVEKLQKHASKGAGHDDIKPAVADYMNESRSNPDFEIPENADRKAVLQGFFDRLLMR